MAEYICATLSSRIRLRMAGVPIMISCAATRPPLTRFSSVWEITACSDSDNMERTMSFSSAGKHVDDPVDGFGRRGGVQRAEYQVTRFRGGQRQADGFQVPQLTDQDDVRVFTQRRAQRLVEAVGIAMHLTLVHEALLGFVHKFDGSSMVRMWSYLLSLM